MDDKTQPEANQEEQPKAEQGEQAPAAEASPEEMEAAMQAALAQMPRNAEGALLKPETAIQVSEGVYEGEVLPDGQYAITTADGKQMQIDVKNTDPKAAGQAPAEQTGMEMAGQPGLADLPAPEASDMDKAASENSSKEKDSVLTAMRDAVGSRVMAASGFDVDAAGADAALITAVDKLAQKAASATPADLAPDASAPREPSHAARQAGEVVGKYTGELAKTGAAAGMGGPSR